LVFESWNNFCMATPDRSVDQSLPGEVPAFPDFMLPGLAAGNVGVFSSSPDVSKASLALTFAVAVAKGQEVATILGAPVARTTPERVMFISTRDGNETFLVRLQAIWRRVSGDAAQPVAASNLVLAAIADDRFDLRNPPTASNLARSIFSTKCAFVVIDSLEGLHPGNPDNIDSLAEILAALTGVANLTNAAILLLHDGPAPTRLSGGALALTPASAHVLGRLPFAASLNLMTPEEAQGLTDPDRPMTVADEDKAGMRRQYVRYSVDLADNSDTLPEDIWYRFGADGIPVRATLRKISGQPLGRLRSVQR
jgi:AAA domain